MGICGTAMGNIAVLMKRQGHTVTGSDTGVYPPMSNVLADEGIVIEAGFDPDRLEACAPDLVIIGNAMSRGNTEIEWLLETRRFPMVSLPELVSREILSHRRNIVVAGTHGKTTTSTLAAYLLEKAGLKPGWMIGGVPLDLPSGAALGHAGGPFVIEGDEYDSAFFDKRSKFIHYQPQVLVLNNLEFDHGDIFRDLEDIQRSFRHVIRLVPCNGCIIYNADDTNLTNLLPVNWTACISVGLSKQADCRIVDFAEDSHGARFRLRWKDGAKAEINWRLPGIFNARNAAMAACSARFIVGDTMETEALLAPLADFQGVKRRQEILLDRPELVVLEDFGHHPTAIRETLTSLRAHYPGHRLTACFEPRSNTACTGRFQRAFTDALALADACYLAPVNRPERYPENDRLNTVRMAEELNARGICSGAFESFDTLIEELTEATKKKRDKPRCVVVFSNGSFGGKLPLYLKHVS